MRTGTWLILGAAALGIAALFLWPSQAKADETQRRQMTAPLPGGYTPTIYNTAPPPAMGAPLPPVAPPPAQPYSDNVDPSYWGSAEGISKVSF